MSQKRKGGRVDIFVECALKLTAIATTYSHGLLSVLLILILQLLRSDISREYFGTGTLALLASDTYPGSL